ncbi:hypothetical protein FB451DRAFT_1268053 [Mycena latifolia]|nr:hypothetical protein FB451DRAFT_1268053 [Mycena latifolia]
MRAHQARPPLPPLHGRARTWSQVPRAYLFPYLPQPSRVNLIHRVRLTSRWSGQISKEIGTDLPVRARVASSGAKSKMRRAYISESTGTRRICTRSPIKSLNVLQQHKTCVEMLNWRVSGGARVRNVSLRSIEKEVKAAGYNADTSYAGSRKTLARCSENCAESESGTASVRSQGCGMYAYVEF